MAKKHKKEARIPRDPDATGRSDQADDGPSITEELNTIYGKGEGAKPDMTRLDQARHSTVKKILIGLIVFFGVLTLISWAGFFFFSPTDDKFSGEGLELLIDGPSEVKSGGLVTYAIRYDNREKVPLGTASLEVRLPKDFMVTESEPASESMSWQIGAIPPGNGGEISLSGIYLSELDKELDIQAIMTYRPADFNSEFQKVATRTVLVSDSVLTTGITGPNKILPGDAVSLTFSYKNESETEFSQLRLQPVYPESFIPDPELDIPSDESGWIVERVEPQGEGSIEVMGTFASDAQGELKIGSRIGFLDGNEEFRLQAEAEFTTEVLEGELITALILNGKTDDQTVGFGDLLRYSVTYRNTGSASLGNIGLSVVFETEPESSALLIWNELRDDAEGVLDGNTITWEKKQVRDLARLEEDEEGVIEFSVPVIDRAIDGSTTEYEITSHVEATIESIDGDIVDRVTKTQPLTVKIHSDTEIANTARYHNDDGIPIGGGPLPPKVGETTTYRIIWQIDNTLHELSDLKLSARLPTNVSWTGTSDVDAGDLQFDAASEKMLWTLNWMPTTIKRLRISFDVTFSPTVGQVGKIPTLIDALIFEATDMVTGSPLLISSPPLTTSLEDDQMAAGKGRVTQ